ncbi:MAG: sulfatase [Kofleriaceae bacterium]
MSSSLPRAMVRIVAVWAALLSLENAISSVRRPAGPYGLEDWLKGQLLGVPVALVVLAPLALVLALVARQVVERRARIVGAGAALVAIGFAYALSTGPTFAAPERRISFVVGAGALAFAFAFVFVRKAPLHRPWLLAGVGAVVAAVAWLADQRVLLGLYPALHAGLVATALTASAGISLVLPELGGARLKPLIWGAVGTLALAWCVVSFVLLQQDEHVRHALLRDAPVLGRMTFLSSQLRFLPDTAQDEHALGDLDDPEIARIVRAREVPRELDWSGCDVLLVTVDALRADHLGSYGYGRPTSPEIDKLAARGARFERAYTSAPNTSYSTASLMTGRNMRPLLVAGTGDGTRVWAEYMRELGYQTMALYPPAVFNVDGHRFHDLRTRGFGFERKLERLLGPDELRDEVSKYVASAPKDEPVFVWMHVFEPHSPYELRAGHPFPGGRDIDAYDSEIATADALIGQAVSLIERRSRCSVIIVTADHGEAFGDHGVTHHGNSVYEEQVRVPLVIVGPGVAPQVIVRPVQTIDLLPTTLSALGERRPRGVHGRDLGPLLKRTRSGADAGLAFAETGRYSMVAIGAERLVCDREASTCALYDISTDPRQLNEIRERPERAQFLRRVTMVLARGEEPVPSFPVVVPATNLRIRRGDAATLESNKLVATGQPGTVSYGPYLRLPAGCYELVWLGHGMSSPGQIAFSVRADSGQEIVAQTVVEANALPLGGGELVRIPFSFDRQRFEVEFVVESGNGGRVALDRLVVARTAEDPDTAGPTFPLTIVATSGQLKRGSVRAEANRLVATGEEGALVYGPYIQLPRGAYELRWEGSRIKSPGHLAFSVKADGGREVLAQVEVQSNERSRDPIELVRIPFVLDRQRSLIEFAIASGGGARVALDQLVLEKVADDPLAGAPRLPLRIAATSAELRRGNVTVSSGGLIATGEPGTLVYGPYLQLPKGKYDLTWLGRRIDAMGKLGFRVMADSGREVIAQAILEANEIPPKGTALIHVPFALDRQRSQIEFVVESSDGGRVVLDELVVESRSSPP